MHLATCSRAMCEAAQPISQILCWCLQRDSTKCNMDNAQATVTKTRQGLSQSARPSQKAVNTSFVLSWKLTWQFSSALKQVAPLPQQQAEPWALNHFLNTHKAFSVKHCFAFLFLFFNIIRSRFHEVSHGNPNYFKINVFIKQVDFGIRKAVTWKSFCQKLVEARVHCSNTGGISDCIVSPLTFRKILLFELSVTWK